VDYYAVRIAIHRCNSKEEAVDEALAYRGKGFRTEVITHEEFLHRYHNQPFQNLQELREGK
jgi:hypothetical protein